MERKKELFCQEKLSAAVHKHPCLFDKTCKSYKDDEVRQDAWKAVAEEMGYSSEAKVEAQWINLRTRFTRQRKLFKSFQGTEPRGNFEIYHLLSWLDDHVLSRNHPKQLMNSDAKPKGKKTEDPTYEGLEEFPTMHSRCLNKPSHVQDVKPEIETEKINEICSYPLENVGLEERKHTSSVDSHFQAKKRKLSSVIKYNNREEKTPKDTQEDRQEDIKDSKLLTQQSNDEDDLFGAIISSQLKKLSEHHRLQAKHEINNIMYQIQMQQLNSPQQHTQEMNRASPSCSSENSNGVCPCNQPFQYSNSNSSCYPTNSHYVTIIDDQPQHNSNKEIPFTSSNGSPTPSCVEYEQEHSFNRQKQDGP